MLTVHIRKSYPGFTLEASFEAEKGALALLGPSGGGKSLTLRCIAGIIKPDEGRIVLDGKVLFDSAAHVNLRPQDRRVGLLFQNYALFPNMTVEENIALGLRRISAPENRRRLTELLAAFYLTPQAGHYPAQLSGGQQQRTALARILAGSPGLIMLDEPLSALDTYLRWQVEQELLGVIEGFPGTVLYVSHNRDEVYRLCRKVCVIQGGRSERVIDVRTFFDAPQTCSAALLSGCKNFSRAQKTGTHRVLALDWNWELECPVMRDDIAVVGIRAHHLSLNEGSNRRPFRVTRIIPEVFSAIVLLKPLDAAGRASPLRMETTRAQAEGLRPGDTVEAGVPPEQVLLLI